MPYKGPNRGWHSRSSKQKMYIITCNIPENIIDVIDKWLAGNKYGLYTSRSEFIRHAVYDKIKNDLKNMDEMGKVIIENRSEEELEAFKIKNAHVPNGDGTYTDYKIVRRLEY